MSDVKLSISEIPIKIWFFFSENSSYFITSIANFSLGPNPVFFKVLVVWTGHLSHFTIGHLWRQVHIFLRLSVLSNSGLYSVSFFMCYFRDFLFCRMTPRNTCVFWLLLFGVYVCVFPTAGVLSRNLNLSKWKSQSAVPARDGSVYPGQAFQLLQAGLQLLPNESFRSPLEIWAEFKF